MHRVRAKKTERMSRRTHKYLKRWGRYACDGCYVCSGIETARFSKRELAALAEPLSFTTTPVTPAGANDASQEEATEVA